MTTYNDVLDDLQYYILGVDKLCEMDSDRKQEREKERKQGLVPVPVPVQELKPQPEPIPLCKSNPVSNSVPKIYVPQQQDTLFWCYYIIKNGDNAYEMLHNKNSLVAKQLKIELVSLLRGNKDIVKMYKFDTIVNLESNLANDNTLNKKTFLTLCAIENINVLYVSKKMYYELKANDSNDVYIVNEIGHKHGFELATQDKLESIRNSLYKLDVIDKPIKSISFYKVQDLIDICTKLAIETTKSETGKHKSKNDLYEAIVQYF